MVKTVRKIFQLLHQDELLFIELEPQYVEATMNKIMDEGTLLIPTLKMRSFLFKDKMMINIIHICFLGLLGSDQVFTHQQMLLAWLMSDREIN